MRSYLDPDATAPPPRFGRVSSQIRSCLVPDSLKSKGLELRRVMRSTSTDVARERRQGILLKPTILKILLGAGFKVALLPSSFGCPVAMSLKKTLYQLSIWKHIDEMLRKCCLTNWQTAHLPQRETKKILAKEISSRGFFCLFDCSIIQRGA